MWEYCQRKFGWCWRSKTTKMIPWKKGSGGGMKAYVWMGRKSRLMNSSTMDKERKIVVLSRNMQKTVLKRAIATLTMSEAKAAIQLRSRPHRKILSN